MRISTWNINGLRSGLRSGLENWLANSKNDIVCLQEIKIQEDLLTRSWFVGYQTHCNSARRSGYSGVATLITRHLEPITVETGIGDKATDLEGRVLTTEFLQFVVVNAYAPHSHRLLKRLDHKRSFCRHLIAYLRKLRNKGKPIIVVGDLNVAHQDTDLSNPKANRNNAGFLPEEREWFTALLSEGFVDAFRLFESGGGHYTWWSPIRGVRERNIGWRLDYILVDQQISNSLRTCFHSPEQKGSDHCPVTADLEL